MATTTQHPAGRPGPGAWVVVVTVAGLDRGMVGPFPSEEVAAAWAGAEMGSDARVTWRVDPVVAPAVLATAAARRAARRRHLTVVR